MYSLISNRIIVLLMGVMATLFLIFLIIEPPFFTTTDLNLWQYNFEKLLNCLNQEKLTCNKLGKFPIAYLLNSSFIYLSGLSAQVALLLLNTLVMVLPIGFILLTSNKLDSIKKTLILFGIFLYSPIAAYYVFSGALEFQSGVVLGVLMSTLIYCLNHKSKFGITVLLVITLFLWPFYKDTNLLLLSISLLCSSVCYPQVRENLTFEWIRKVILYRYFLVTMITVLSSAILMVWFNFYKFRSIFPIPYFKEAVLTSPSGFKSFEFFIASIFSFNGGLIVFWALSFYCSILLLNIFNYRISRTALLLSSILVIFSLIGQSLWWAPFGWDSWGNRLMVPSMLAANICIVLTSLNSNINGIPSINNGWVSDKTLRYQFLTSKAKRVLQIIFISFSLNYVFVSYISAKEKLFVSSLFAAPSCQAMIAKVLSDDMNLRFWKSESYYDCARDRFVYLPSYLK